MSIGINKGLESVKQRLSRMPAQAECRGAAENTENTSHAEDDQCLVFHCWPCHCACPKAPTVWGTPQCLFHRSKYLDFFLYFLT